MRASLSGRHQTLKRVTLLGRLKSECDSKFAKNLETKFKKNVDNKMMRCRIRVPVETRFLTRFERITPVEENVHP